MTGTELADYLRALPAEQLQSIELITNPPAQYDAQGGAGVIAINLKKDQRLGTNGSVNASYGRGRYGKFTSGLTLNHRNRHLNAYASYTYANRTELSRLDSSRRFTATPQLAAARSDSDRIQLTDCSRIGPAGDRLKPVDPHAAERRHLGPAEPDRYDTRSETRFLAVPASLPTALPPWRPGHSSAQWRGNVNLRHAFAIRPRPVGQSDADAARYTHHAGCLRWIRPYDTAAQPSRLLSGNQHNA